MTETPIVFYLPSPPSANNLYPTSRRTGLRFSSPRYKAWIEEAALAVRSQKPAPIAGRVRVLYECHRPDNRRRDLLNLEKAISDLLVKAGVIEDDCLIWEATMRWRQDERGGVRVTILPFSGPA